MLFLQRMHLVLLWQCWWPSCFLCLYTLKNWNLKVIQLATWSTLLLQHILAMSSVTVCGTASLWLWVCRTTRKPLSFWRVSIKKLLSMSVWSRRSSNRGTKFGFFCYSKHTKFRKIMQLIHVHLSFIIKAITHMSTNPISMHNGDAEQHRMTSHVYYYVCMASTVWGWLKMQDRN